MGLGRAMRDGWPVPVGLLGMMVLTCAVERFVSKQRTTFTAPLVLEWRATRRAAATDAPGCALLYVGSSTIKNGVVPEVIEDVTGLRGYNLALAGGTPPVAYYMLRRALDHGARPSAVIVDFCHGRLESDPLPDGSIHAWAQLLDPLEAIDLARWTGDGSFFGQLLAARVLPTVRIRRDLRRAVVSALEGRPVSQQTGAMFYDRNRKLNRGAHVHPKLPSFQDSPSPTVMIDLSASWKCHPVNAAFVERFLDLAQSRGIAVYWLMPPFPPGHQAQYDWTHGEKNYLQLVRRLVERYPRLTVIDGRHADYPATVFIDPVHLDRTGAAALSESLASVLVRNPGPDGARWVDLARFRVSSREAGLEDTFQSAVAVQTGRGTSRR
jgi:hypothetical protein